MGLKRVLAITSLCMAWSFAAVAEDWTELEQHVKNRRWDQARQQVQMGLQAHPRDVRLRLLQGVIQAQTGQLAQARQTLEQLTADAPEFSQAHNNLGIVLALQGEPEAAVRAFERAQLADPNNPAATANLARAQALVATESK